MGGGGGHERVAGADVRAACRGMATLTDRVCYSPLQSVSQFQNDSEEDFRAIQTWDPGHGRDRIPRISEHLIAKPLGAS